MYTYNVYYIIIYVIRFKTIKLGVNINNYYSETDRRKSYNLQCID